MTEVRLPDRALRLVDGAPDVSFLPCDRLLDEGGAEYMRRFHMSHARGPQRRFHLISADDPGRDWHDHPWDYVTRLLSGSYIEHTPDGDITYAPGDVLVRKAEALHRLELVSGPVWTYFVTGRFRRPWGFLTPSGWVPHGSYAAAGQVTGCGPGRVFLGPGKTPYYPPVRGYLRSGCALPGLAWDLPCLLRTGKDRGWRGGRGHAGFH